MCLGRIDLFMDRKRQVPVFNMVDENFGRRIRGAEGGPVMLRQSMGNTSAMDSSGPP